MASGFLIDAFGVIGRLEVWLGGALWGAMILGGANFLAAGYTGPRSVFDKALSAWVFLGMGLFLILVGPGMALKSASTLSAFVWFDPQATAFTPKRALITFGIGIGFAVLTRIPPFVTILPSRLFACFNQALATLSTITYFATEGAGRFVPSLAALVGLGLSGMFIVFVAQTILEVCFPKAAARTWLFLGPLIVSVAASPWAGWLRSING